MQWPTVSIAIASFSVLGLGWMILPQSLLTRGDTGANRPTDCHRAVVPTLLSAPLGSNDGARLAKPEVAKLADSFRAALADALSQMDDAGLFRLRSELSAIRAVAEGGKDKSLSGSLERALAAVTKYHSFASEVKGFVVSRDFSSKASLFDIGSIGVLAMENVLTAERKSLFRLLMSGLSEGLAFAASRQYIYGSTAVLDGLYRTNSASLYDDLWALATEFRGPMDEKAAREVQAGLDGFFHQIAAPGVPVDVRVAAVYQMYGVLVLVRCADLVKRLSG